MPPESTRKYALQNAVLHGGKAEPKAVLGKLLAEDPALRPRARELSANVERIVAEVNRLGPDVQRAQLEALAPELLERPKAEAGPKELPLLPDAEDGKVVCRLAPYPSGPLHIGNARAFVLNDAYVKRYHGRLLLVFDDTIGSEEKPLLPEAFDQVKEGLDWAGLELLMQNLLGRKVEVAMRRSLKPFVKDTILSEAVEVFPELGRRSNEDEGIDMPAHKARQHLQDIVDAITEIDAFVAGKSYDDYLASALLRRGVERDIEIISEASRRIPADLIARYPQVPWHQIAAIGNILRHAYRTVDSSIIWTVVTVELAPLRQAVEGMIAEVEKPPGN